MGTVKRGRMLAAAQAPRRGSHIDLQTRTPGSPEKITTEMSSPRPVFNGKKYADKNHCRENSPVASQELSDVILWLSSNWQYDFRKYEEHTRSGRDGGPVLYQDKGSQTLQEIKVMCDVILQCAGVAFSRGRHLPLKQLFFCVVVPIVNSILRI